MKVWHVMTEEGWVRVESVEEPKYGKLAHVEQPTCCGWDCFWAKTQNSCFG